MRTLTPVERHDLAVLARHFDAVAPFEVTSTQLSKSIIDATDAIRAAMASVGYHDYDRQTQGPAHKVVNQVVLSVGTGIRASRISLYRPETKQGDPRFWLGADFARAAAPGEVWALCLRRDGSAYATRLGPERRDSIAAEEPARLFAPESDEDRPAPSESVASLVAVAPTISQGSASAERLLARLREIASRGPITTQVAGDTAVGVAIESALGIAANADKGPDWEGTVEIKGHRHGASQNMNTIVSRIPDWTLTNYGSRQAVLERFGVRSDKHDGRRRLYNTVSSQYTNSHGLRLSVDYEADELHAVHDNSGEVAMAWRFSTLRQAIAAKHSETFWVKAQATGPRSREEFELVSVVHTAGPQVWAIPSLIDEGLVTLDTTIGEKPDGSARDHGWLFRMFRRNLGELFPTIDEYQLA